MFNQINKFRPKVQLGKSSRNYILINVQHEILGSRDNVGNLFLPLWLCVFLCAVDQKKKNKCPPLSASKPLTFHCLALFYLMWHFQPERGVYFHLVSLDQRLLRQLIVWSTVWVIQNVKNRGKDPSRVPRIQAKCLVYNNENNNNKTTAVA